MLANAGPNFLKTQNGMSLIEILIASAVSMIVMMGLITIINTQSRETTALQQRLASLDLERLLISSLADGAVCAYVLNNPSVLTFNSAIIPNEIQLPSTTPLYLNILPGPVPGPIAAKVGEPASPISNTLIIDSIKLQISSGTIGRYEGNWVINFDPNKIIRGIKPVIVSTTLIVDDTVPTASKIIGCQGAGSGLGRFQRVTLSYPLEPTGGGWVLLNSANFPTVKDTSGDEIQTGDFIFIPRGTRLEIFVRTGDSVYSDNIGQSLGFGYYFHYQKDSEPEIVLLIGNLMTSIGLQLGGGIGFGKGETKHISIDVVPGSTYKLKFGAQVNCDPTQDCPNAHNARYKVWSPVWFSIQEYY
jgi:hypothetical protein